jgi:hypothetical protein
MKKARSAVALSPEISIAHSKSRIGDLRGRNRRRRFGMGDVEFKSRDLGSDRGYRVALPIARYHSLKKC